MVGLGGGYVVVAAWPTSTASASLAKLQRIQESTLRQLGLAHIAVDTMRQHGVLKTGYVEPGVRLY